MLRFGPHTGPVVVAAMPLLEEWNRTRAFVVALLRALAARGIGSVLPDLPGHGESLRPLPDVERLRSAMSAAADHVAGHTVALGVRSGSLLDDGTAHIGRWYLSPVTGPELLRDLDRVRLASGSRDSTMIAGTTLSAAFLGSLEGAAPRGDARIVRLASDPRQAARHVDGAPLWRRAEPGNDPRLVEVLAADIAAWIKTCAG